MYLDPSFLANAFLFAMILSAQFGWFDDIFDDVFDDDGSTDLDTILEDTEISPLYDPDLYTEEVQGTAGNDAIIANAEDNAFAYFLGGGNDQLTSTSGADFVQAGLGDDRLVLREGDDLALGGSGDDQIFGGRGSDTMFGGEGDDLINGSLHDDIIWGDDGDDTLSGGRDDDELHGGAGDDLISGDVFDGTGGLERGIDTLFGDDGDDTLWLFGDDTGTGGEGGDLFRVFDTNDPDALVTITDYAADEDRIEVVFPAAEGDPVPELTVETVPDTEDAQISLGGMPVAVVTGGAGLAAEDVVLTTTI